jgi:hypothetical protein
VELRETVNRADVPLALAVVDAPDGNEGFVADGAAATRLALRSADNDDEDEDVVIGAGGAAGVDDEEEEEEDDDDDDIVETDDVGGGGGTSEAEPTIVDTIGAAQRFVSEPDATPTPN